MSIRGPPVSNYFPGVNPHNFITKFRKEGGSGFHFIFGASIKGDKLNINEISGNIATL